MFTRHSYFGSLLLRRDRVQAPDVCDLSITAAEGIASQESAHRGQSNIRMTSIRVHEIELSERWVTVAWCMLL